MSLSEEEVRARLLRAIGRKVKFKYPGNAVDKHGRLMDREIIRSGDDERLGAVYWDVVDLIEFLEEEHTQWIRIGYYRQVGDRIRWGSQTTITEPLHIMRRVFAQAAREKKWFRDLLPSNGS